MEGGGWRVEGGGWRVEGGGWRVEGGGWEGGGWRVEQRMDILSPWGGGSGTASPSRSRPHLLACLRCVPALRACVACLRAPHQALLHPPQAFGCLL